MKNHSHQAQNKKNPTINMLKSMFIAGFRCQSQSCQNLTAILLAEALIATPDLV